MKQSSFASLSFDAKKKQTRSEAFLAQMVERSCWFKWADKSNYW